jgi:putative two-component system response regulator
VIEGVRKQSILLVDDTPENIEVLNGILSPHYKIRFATHGEKALQVARSVTPPDLILLDVMMPGISGHVVCRELKADPRTRHIPVIFVTALGEVADEKEGFSLGAVDYIAKPVNAPIVLARVRTHLALYDQQRELERQVLIQTREISTTRLEIIRRLGRAAEYKDNETGLHVIRMSHYVRLLSEAVGLPDLETDIIFNAAPMHDVGKIGIPDSILLKPGPLDPSEWTVMKKHPAIGAEIIGKSDSPLLQAAATIALTHHEKWDGSGYPVGLRGEAIPLIGRIVAIADVFDALTTQRPYKPAWSVERAVEMLKDSNGTHFDPALVKHFMKILPAVLEIREQLAESPPVAS